MTKKLSPATNDLQYAFGRLMSRLELGGDCGDLVQDMKEALAKGADKTMLIQMLSILRECLGESAKK